MSGGTAETRVDTLRRSMIHDLREMAAIVSDPVAAAFDAVPRHLFAPEVSPEAAYAANTPVVTKRDPHGVAISSVSAAHIQACMLEQAELSPGMRVLEIGSGGYNAALISEIVGPTGSVISLDIDPEIVTRARECLDAAGYDQVVVELGDAEQGLAEHAPFDRVIVTVGAWDIPPAWINQLTDSGRIVVPLRVNGLTRSFTLERAGDHLVSLDYRLCGFVPMQGIGSYADKIISLDPAGVAVRFDGQPAVDVDALRAAVASPRVERWSGVTVGAVEAFDDLDLWIITEADHFGVLTATQDVIDRGLVSVGRAGAKTIISGGSFAYRPAARPSGDEETRYEFGVFAHGPDADALAEKYIELIRTWDRDHRGGPGARIEIHPATTPRTGLPPGRVIDKRHTHVVISWP